MLIFVTAVKHPDNSESYEDVWRLLNNTLYSVCSQNDTNFRVVVVCDKKMPLNHHANLINKYTDFVEVDFPSHSDDVVERFKYLGNLSPPIDDPKWWKQWSRDRKKPGTQKRKNFFCQIRKFVGSDSKNEKRTTYMSAPEINLMANYALNRGSKQLIGILAAKKHNPEYVLMFDADDYVGNDIASYVNANPGENGWIMTHGYKMADDLIAPKHSHTSFCGTGNIINYSLLLEEIPAYLSVTSSQDDLFEHVNSEFLVTLARHGKVRWYYKRKERIFLDYPTRSAIHLLGHQDSNDYQRRRLRKEPTGLRLEEAQKDAGFSPITQKLMHYFGILTTAETKAFIDIPDVTDKKKETQRGQKAFSPFIRTGTELGELIPHSVKLTQASERYQRFGAILARAPLYPSSIKYNLTISEEKKFVWFRVGKVGSRTIMDIFKQAAIELAAEHSFDVQYPINLYRDYFKFAFVRNPWDRLVSCWQDKVIRRGKFRSFGGDRTFEDFVDYVELNEDLLYGNPHLRLQSRLIDLNHIDFLGRLETFDENLKEVMSILGIEALIKKKNATNRNPDYRKYYTGQARDKVAKLYEKDIKLFGYKF
jgi:hypothetical protein